MGKHALANSLCGCGSGKKYKKCCINKSESNNYLADLIKETLFAFNMERSELEKRIILMEELIKKSKLSNFKLLDVNIHMFQLYILAGEDKKALDIINNSISIDKQDIHTKIFILTNKIKILLNLGYASKALKTASILKPLINNLPWSGKESTIKSGALIELGKTYMTLLSYYSNDTGEEVDYSEAISIFDDLIESYHLKKYHDIDHYLGAKSNKAALFLKNSSVEIQKKGLELLNETTPEKVKCGYWVGVANNYSILGWYYFKKKDYRQAIAYTKRDLQITQKYSSVRDEISTLLILGKIYLETLQISKAKEVLRQAARLTERTKNSALGIHIGNEIKKIENIAKKLNLAGKVFGPKAACKCGSGNIFKLCCGQADFDYESVEKILGLENIIPYAKIVDDFQEQTLSNNRDKLELMLKKLNEKEIRLSWIETIGNGAYQEVYELPDMASIHMLSAKSLIENVSSGDLMQETSIALAASILSISALEAFLNQLIFFLATIPVQELPEFIRTKIPEELITDYSYYQRNTKFSDKINCIADIFCNGKWSPAIGKVYTDLFKLISIRNELVHFKSVEYTKIIPPPKENTILKNLSSEVKLRDLSNSWPLKILNETFARWSVKTVDDAINYIKDRYESSIKLQD